MSQDITCSKVHYAYNPCIDSSAHMFHMKDMIAQTPLQFPHALVVPVRIHLSQVSIEEVGAAVTFIKRQGCNDKLGKRITQLLFESSLHCFPPLDLNLPHLVYR